jgi:hypothetical protein
MPRCLSLALLAALAAPLNAEPPKATGGSACSTHASGLPCCDPMPSIGKTTSGPKKAKVSPCSGLIEILETTQDPDTFLMAVSALPALGEKGCRALPAVVRNAERLGLLKGLCKGPMTPVQQALLNCLQQIGAPPAPPAPVPPPGGYGYGAPYPVPTPVMTAPPALGPSSSCVAAPRGEALPMPEEVKPMTPATQPKEDLEFGASTSFNLFYSGFFR